MRWGLLWWNLMTVLVSSIGVEEEQVDPKDEMEPVEPVDTVELIDQFLEQQTTQACRVAFYKPGTDFFTIPELYRNIKAGKNTSGLYMGPTFTKEFMMKTPSEKRLTAGFKLLDWKRRRKRLDEANQKGKINSIKIGERIKKECPGTKDKAVTDSKSAQVTKSTEEGMTNSPELSNIEKENSVIPTSKEIKDEETSPVKLGSTNVDDNLKGDLGIEEPVKVYTQPTYGQVGIRLSSSDKHCESRLRNRPDRCLKFGNETRKRRRLNRRNSRSRKRSKREEESSFEDFVEYKRAIPDDSHTNLDKNISETSSYTTPYESTHSTLSTQTEFLQMTTCESSTNENLCSTSLQSEETTPSISAQTVTDKQESFSTTLPKKDDVPKENKKTSKSVLSKAKSKIVIGGEEIPLHIMPRPEPSLDHGARLLTNVGVVFACVTPPPATTLNSLQREEVQRAECHPKGSGPLSPMALDPEAYGPRNEEEVEDALTGKLADRVVEVVMAKVGKTPRMLKELGLYAQGNLTKIQCSVSHPEGKQACKEQSSDSMKLSVLQDIAAAVERLASTKSSGLCLKPPEDLSDFLCWLLSEDSEMDMPEPSSHFSLQPRREADYLFRSTGITDELINDVRDIERKCNWENWMSFAEDSPEDIAVEKVTVPDEFEGKGHVKQPKNFKRLPRHLLHRKRIAKQPGERGRRRRYTPWSLNDYP